MAAKKSTGRFSKMAAVIFTTLVAPIVANVTASAIKGENPRGASSVMSAAASTLPPAILAVPEARVNGAVQVVCAKPTVDSRHIIVATSRPAR